MTPAQMRRVVGNRPVWKAPEVGQIVLTDRMSPDELAYAEESAALALGICPKCQLKVRLLTPQVDQRVRFQCESNDVYHFFVRGDSFLKFD